MVEMSVAGIALDASNRTPIVLLKDPSGRRQVPIWIDNSQAHSILAGIQPPPGDEEQTHDLIIKLIKAGHLHLERVIIHSIEKNVFQAVLQLLKPSSQGTQENANCPTKLEIEASPSDAIALAVRSKCSIWMLEDVVSEASIPVDAEADAADRDEFRRFLEKVNPAALIKHLETRENERQGE